MWSKVKTLVTLHCEDARVTDKYRFCFVGLNKIIITICGKQNTTARVDLEISANDYGVNNNN